jgi:hypothetical protein
MNNYTIRRTGLAKPVKGLLPVEPVIPQPVELSKITNSNTAIEFLDQFIREARKEIRKREELTLKGKFKDTNCDSISFLCGDLSISINFAGGTQS